jgi:hypothetical protein
MLMGEARYTVSCHIGSYTFYGSDCGEKYAPDEIVDESLSVSIVLTSNSVRGGGCQLVGSSEPVPVDHEGQILELFDKLKPGDAFTPGLSIDGFEYSGGRYRFVSTLLLPVVRTASSVLPLCIKFPHQVVWDVLMCDMRQPARMKAAGITPFGYFSALLAMLDSQTLADCHARFKSVLHQWDIVASAVPCSAELIGLEPWRHLLLDEYGVMLRDQFLKLLGISRGTFYNYTRGTLTPVEHIGRTVQAFEVSDLRKLVLRPMLESREGRAYRERVAEVADRLQCDPLHIADLIATHRKPPGR